jgi:phosphohistidine phosphatase
MKTIYLVRHGKSSWTHKDVSDDQRPLLVKGENNTKNVAEYFVKHKLAVDVIISSHAIRAYETAKIIAAVIKYPEKEIKIDNQIYFSDGEGYFDVFYELSNDINSVMLVGHNPSITNFANHFIENKIENIPTSAVVCISFNKMKDWHDIIKPRGQEVFRLFDHE